MPGRKNPGILICCLGFCFFSCASGNTVMVPFENQKVNQNLCLEYYTIAQEYKELKKYDKAIEFYKKASHLKSLRKDCYYGISMCHAYSKDWDSARKEFELLLKTDPENQNLIQSLAYIEAMSGNLEKAEELYSGIFEKNMDDSSILKDYLNLLLAMKKNEEAKQKYDLLVEKFPDDADILTFKNEFPEDEKKEDSEKGGGEEEYIDDGED